MQTIDAKGANLGLALRPWVATDHLKDMVISDLYIKNITNGKALYVPVWSDAAYLVSKKSSGAVIDPKQYPNGYWYNSLTISNIVIDGVKRTDGVSHCDGIYTLGCNVPGIKPNLTIDNYTIINADGSVMPILMQYPGNWGTVTLSNLKWSAVQNRVDLKNATTIDLIRIIDCACSLTINAPEVKPGFVKRIEISNSPNVDVNALKAQGTQIVYLTVPSPVIPIPSGPVISLPPEAAPVISAPTPSIVSVSLNYSDGTVKTIPVT